MEPKKWINANDCPNDQAEIDYWINTAKQFPDVSLDFLDSDDFSIDVVSESQPLESKTLIDNISGIEEIPSKFIYQKQDLFISEIETKKKKYTTAQPTNSKNPCIYLQYNYEQIEVNSTDFQSETDFFDISKTEKKVENKEISESENDDTIHVVLPIYSIEKHICNEKNDFISIEDMKFAEIAQGVSKRHISKKEKLSANNEPIIKSIKQKEASVEKKSIQISDKKNDFNSNDSINSNQLSDNLNISIKDCFMIEDILFFVVETNPENGKKHDTENKTSQTICLPENIMKKHFPNVLFKYYEKLIIFDE